MQSAAQAVAAAAVAERAGGTAERAGGTAECAGVGVLAGARRAEHMGTEQRADSNWTSQTAAMVQLNKDRDEAGGGQRQESHARRTEG